MKTWISARVAFVGLALAACAAIEPPGSYRMTSVRTGGANCPEIPPQTVQIDVKNTLRYGDQAGCTLVESDGGDTLSGACPSPRGSIFWSLTFDLNSFSGTRTDSRPEGTCEYRVSGTRL